MKKSFFTSSMFFCLIITMLGMLITFVSLHLEKISVAIFFTIFTAVFAMILPACSTNE